jgi:hypothetical protein
MVNANPSKLARRASHPNKVTRKEIELFKGHYADLLAQGDDVGRNYRNQHGHGYNSPPRDRQSLQVKLTELDYEFANYFGSGVVVHGIRRALAEARGRCCECHCCNKVRLNNQRPDVQAIVRRERIERIIASGYFK